MKNKSLTKAAKSTAEAVKHAQLAYQFSPGFYTYWTLHACLAAKEAVDQHREESKLP
jgi:hypothetical protein